MHAVSCVFACQEELELLAWFVVSHLLCFALLQGIAAQSSRRVTGGSAIYCVPTLPLILQHLPSMCTNSSKSVSQLVSRPCVLCILPRIAVQLHELHLYNAAGRRLQVLWLTLYHSDLT